MKKTIATILSITAVLCLNAEPFQSGFVTPIVPDEAIPAGFTDPVLLDARTWYVTSRLDSGPGTLRAAISNAAAGDRIRFLLRPPAVIVLSNQLDIARSLAILGPGPDCLTIMRSDATNTPSFRLFNVQTGTVTIAGVTLKNGRALNVTGFASNLGGGVLNRAGDLTISNCVVTGNTAPTENGGSGFGGGIFSIGPLRVVDSTIADNDATAAGGGIGTFHSERFLLEHSTVSGNFAAIQGGGVNFQGVRGVIRNCTISANSTAGDGTASALLTLCFGNEGAVLNVTACTITRNTGGGGTNGAFVLAALDGNLGLTNRLLNNLVASNDSPNFSISGNPVLETLGHNLDSDGSSGLTNSTNGDLVGTQSAPLDAKLSALQDNGGPTYTHSLLVGSPALDSGSALDADRNPLRTDQRHFVRPVGPAGDIGAVENQAPNAICSGLQHCESTNSQGSAAEFLAIVADPDGDAMSVVWSADGTPFRTNFVDATHPPEPKLLSARTQLSRGNHVITVSAWDGKAAPVVCTTRVTVGDRTPPRIRSIVATPSVLTPKNHKLMPVRLTVDATDTSGPVASRIVSVKSNEPQGKNAPDWVITGDLTVKLRAETEPRSTGRIYTITVACSDTEGNTSRGTVTVTVPGNRRNQGNGHGQGHNEDKGDKGDKGNKGNKGKGPKGDKGRDSD